MLAGTEDALVPFAARIEINVVDPCVLSDTYRLLRESGVRKREYMGSVCGKPRGGGTTKKGKGKPCLCK